MKRILIAALCVTAGFAALGCETTKRTAPPAVVELQPRPMLKSVPMAAKRVQASQGTGELSYGLVKGQRYYLVNETTDKVLNSDVASKDGKIVAGPQGAKFAGMQIWPGGAPTTDRIALYVSDALEDVK